jgi:hypothetical protein
MSVFLSPFSLLLTAVAWLRAPHDSVFWAGVGLNAVLAFGLLAILIALVTGDASIGLD